MSNIAILSGSNSKKHYARSIDRMCLILEEGGFSPCNVSTTSTLENLDTDHEQIEINIPTCILKYTLIAHIVFQIKSSYVLVNNRSDIETVVLFKGAMGLFLPVIAGRVFGLNTVVIKSGALMNERDLEHSQFISELYTQAQLFSFWISDASIVFNEDAKKTIPSSDIYVANPEYIDIERFKVNSEYSEREKIIGYVGRFGNVKRIDETVHAVKNITQNSEYKGLFVGDGVQYNSIVSRYGSYSSLQFTGWVDYDELPRYYNRMKLLVIASDAEGGPATALEAMACGVPVVGTKVGMLPDLLDDDCGVLLEDNSVKCISSGIETALMSIANEDTSEKCKRKITRRYTLSAVAKRYNEVLHEINSNAILP